MPKTPKPKTESLPLPTQYLITDPLYRFTSRMPTMGIWLIVLLSHVFVYVTVGFTIDNRYPTATDLLGIRDLAEIINGINVWVIFVPIVWAYYRWLPENIISGIREIEDAHVIKVPEEYTARLSSILLRRINSSWIYVLALTAMIISFFYLLLVVIPQQQVTLNGLIDFWYYTTGSTFFFFLLYLPANYVTFVFALRVLVIVISVNSFFQDPRTVACLYPLHPDKCGGMGNIGGLVSKITLVLVLVPIWITIFSLYTVLAGGESQFITALIVYAVYLVILPIVLFLPLWQPHKAMVQYKNELLLRISKDLLKIETELSQDGERRDPRKVKEKLEQYRQLEEMYNTLEKNIPIWPISMPVLRGFGAIAGSPVVIGFLSNIAFEYFKNMVSLGAK